MVSQGTEEFLESQKGYQQISHASLGVCVMIQLYYVQRQPEISFIGGLASIIGYGRVKKDIEESKKISDTGGDRTLAPFGTRDF